MFSPLTFIELINIKRLTPALIACLARFIVESTFNSLYFLRDTKCLYFISCAPAACITTCWLSNALDQSVFLSKKGTFIKFTPGNLFHFC